MDFIKPRRGVVKDETPGRVSLESLRNWCSIIRGTVRVQILAMQRCRRDFAEVSFIDICTEGCAIAAVADTLLQREKRDKFFAVD